MALGRLRLFIPRGRLVTGETRFGGRARLRWRKYQEPTHPTSTAAPNTARQARNEIKAKIPLWNPDGTSGRAELGEILRRAGQ